MDRKKLMIRSLSVFAGAAVLALSQLATALPVVCGVNTTEDATANGAYADACDYTASNIASQAAITDHTNSLWGGDGLFSYVGKHNEVGMPGFSLVITPGDAEHKYGYQLIVPDAWTGVTVDWVLGVKQANNSYMSYLFEDVVLGIDGGFNNFWLNPRDKLVNDYSFAAGFIRKTTQVPEPGMLLLMLAGIGGLVASRRRKMNA